MNTLIHKNTNFLSEPAVVESESGPLIWPAQTVRFALFAMALMASFASPLVHLKQSSHQSLFYEYIPFVHFISGLLIYWDRLQLPRRASRDWPTALALALAGLGLLGVYWGAIRAGFALEETEALALTTAAFLLLLLAGTFFFFGPRFMRAIAFPVALLGFLIPPPPSVLNPIVSFLQTSSVWFARAFFWMAGTPCFNSGTLLELPNFKLEIAPACGGFHAGVMLLLVGMMCGHACFRSRWNRLWLALAIIPLAIIRNGLRIYVLGEVCVLFGAQELESPLHHEGGAIFFVLSLLPLLILVATLKRIENRSRGHGETVKALEEKTPLPSPAFK